MVPVVLAVDIGNSNITMGIFEEEKLKKRDGFPVNLKWEIYDFSAWLDKFLASAIWEKNNVKAVVIASVVPQLNNIFIEITKTNFGFEPMIVNSDLVLGIRINVDNPEEIGGDRLANAVAVNHLYPRQSVIAVDFGTAVTFDIIDQKKGYVGGVIAPGINMVQQALCEKTALLPQIELVKPRDVFGKTTEGSMQAGIYFGMLGQVKLILDNLIKFFKGKVLTIATGGWADLLAEQITEIKKIEPDLTLYGLWKISELNRGNKQI